MRVKRAGGKKIYACQPQGALEGWVCAALVSAPLVCMATIPEARHMRVTRARESNVMLALNALLGLGPA
jgi:hypothetical protein